MPTKKINFDVFQLEVINDAGERIKFEDFLLKKLDKYEKITQADSPIVQIDEIKQDGKFIFGTFAHNQMNDLPSSMDIDTNKIEDLPLKPSQGLVYFTSFMFDIDLQMIAFESNKNGVYLKSFLFFFERNFLLPEILSSWVLEPATVRAIDKWGYLKRFSVRIARVQNGEIFHNKKSSFKQIIKSADDTNTSVLDYTIASRQTKKGSLSINRVRQWARDLLAYKETEEVTKLILSGKEAEDDKVDTIDLLAKRIRLSIYIEKSRFSISFALNEKYKLIEKEFLKVRSELLLLYKLIKIK